ncbi:hypothetical protein SCALM49S_03925 [Streptomyces californicus]
MQSPLPDPDPARPADGSGHLDMGEVVGSHDLLLVTLDTLRHDVAVELAAAGRIPHLARHLPGGVWEERHALGQFHLRLAPGDVRGLPADARIPGAPSAAVRGAVRGQ